jgi:4,5-dihydroxyphthalate decarboxylase
MDRPLKVALGDYPWTREVASALVASEVAKFEFVDCRPITTAFRRMCREQAFDVCEMALTTYLVANFYGLPFSALPVFPVRMAHLKMMASAEMAAGSPEKLQGERVGVRAYTVTGGVWARSFLQDYYGVDLDRIAWVLGDDEHVLEFHAEAPANVSYGKGRDLDGMLRSRELAAVIGSSLSDQEGITALIPDQKEKEIDWAKEKAIYPVNHTVVALKSVLSAKPNLAEAIVRAFSEAKETWLAGVGGGEGLSPEEDELLARRSWVGDDPIPYGLDANRPTLEALKDALIRQHIPFPQDIGQWFV